MIDSITYPGDLFYTFDYQNHFIHVAQFMTLP